MDELDMLHEQEIEMEMAILAAQWEDTTPSYISEDGSFDPDKAERYYS